MSQYLPIKEEEKEKVNKKEKYIDEIHRITNLKDEEMESELKKHKRNLIIKLTNELIENYYSLVKKIAYSLSEKLNWKVIPEELTSFGIDGLYVAIRRFDLSKNIKFETYASIRIRGSMIDGIRKEDKIPRSVRINSNRFQKVKNQLECKKGRNVTESEVIKGMGITEEEYLKNIKKYNPVIFSSLENKKMNSEDEFKQDYNINLTDKKNPSPDSQIKRKEFFNKLLGKNFSSLERQIIYMYYYENLTMDVIAEQLNMSESRISQIHKLLMLRLKDKIARNPKYFDNSIKKFIVECNDKSSLL